MLATSPLEQVRHSVVHFCTDFSFSVCVLALYSNPQCVPFQWIQATFANKPNKYESNVIAPEHFFVVVVWNIKIAS